MFMVQDTLFERNSALQTSVGEQSPQQYSCVHIETDGESKTVFKNVTALNGESSAILLRIENENNILHITDSSFGNYHAQFGGATSVEVLNCCVKNGRQNCIYNRKKLHGRDITITNSSFYHNVVTNKGGALSIAPEHKFNCKQINNNTLIFYLLITKEASTFMAQSLIRTQKAV